eukprot:3719654-Prymnesium_polylepis.3
MCGAVGQSCTFGRKHKSPRRRASRPPCRPASPRARSLALAVVVRDRRRLLAHCAAHRRACRLLCRSDRRGPTFVCALSSLAGCFPP